MSAVGRISGLRAPKSPLSAQAFSQRLKKKLKRCSNPRHRKEKQRDRPLLQRSIICRFF